jgi:hypothetical protein
LWLEGYKTVRQKVYLTRDNTFKVKYQMERLPAGEVQEPKPQPLAPPPGQRMRPQQQPMDADRRRIECRRRRRRTSRSRCPTIRAVVSRLAAARATPASARWR